MEENLHEKLVRAIKEELNLCDSFETPIICQMLNDAGAKEKLISLIIKKVLKQKIEISEAIKQIDGEFNPNAID